MDPVTKFVRELPGDYYTVREVAVELGLSYNTVRGFNDPERKDPVSLAASYSVLFGKVRIFLYVRDDIERIREALEKRKEILPNVQHRTYERIKPMGRPPQYTVEQRKVRQRLHSARHYYNKRAQEAIEQGQVKKSQQYLKRARDIKQRLDKDEL